MLIYYGIKCVGAVMSVFGPNYATYVIGQFLVAHLIGCSVAGYVLGKNIVIIGRLSR